MYAGRVARCSLICIVTLSMPARPIKVRKKDWSNRLQTVTLRCSRLATGRSVESTGVKSIVISLSVCLSVCPLACLENHIPNLT